MVIAADRLQVLVKKHKCKRIALRALFKKLLFSEAVWGFIEYDTPNINFINRLYPMVAADDQLKVHVNKASLRSYIFILIHCLLRFPAVDFFTCKIFFSY